MAGSKGHERCYTLSRLEELTQAVVNVFIKKVTAYRGKRVEIEWDFSE